MNLLEHLLTFARGLRRIGHATIWMIAVLIIGPLPVWAAFVTEFDIISLHNPGNTVWVPIEEFSLTDYIRRAGLVIAAGWMVAFIYSAGKE